MNETSSILKVIQLLKFGVNPVFFVPLILNKNGFSVSKRGTAIIFCSLAVIVACKLYFFTCYETNDDEYHVQFYSFLITECLFVMSYLGYAFNSTSSAKILNKIISQLKYITDHAFCRRVTRVLIIQLIQTHLFPITFNIWCCVGGFFKDYRKSWEYFLDVWIEYLFRIHLTMTTVLFSDAILLCYQIIKKVNKELVKTDRIEWFNLAEIKLIDQEKTGRKNRLVSSESELASMISIYDRVCQYCADLNAFFGCSLSCSYVCNLIQSFIILFFITRYGISELWFFFFGASYNFLQNWFLLYACETFTKEMQNTGIIVNRLILETKSQRQKELLQQFSIFLLHRNVKFTAWGLFTLNYKLMYSALATMITYLTLIHQLETESKGNDISRVTTFNLSSIASTSTTVS